MNPYLVLGVPTAADDATIRQAYLAAVRQSPPETHAERFQAVTAAYEQIRDESSRIEYTLFNRNVPGDSPLDVLLRFARLHTPAPLSFEAMTAHLRAAWKP